VDSGSYNQIISGEYLRRDQDNDDDVIKNFRDAARRYKDAINSSEDPLAETLRNAMETAGNVKDRAKDAFDVFFNNRKS
ncbi:MAG: hypothetical protein ABIR47_05580, partial [Candidatus Kapaibacterium sp.]